jgi:hypothetical protein
VNVGIMLWLHRSSNEAFYKEKGIFGSSLLCQGFRSLFFIGIDVYSSRQHAKRWKWIWVLQEEDFLGMGNIMCLHRPDQRE